MLGLTLGYSENSVITKLRYKWDPITLCTNCLFYQSPISLAIFFSVPSSVTRISQRQYRKDKHYVNRLVGSDVICLDGK